MLASLIFPILTQFTPLVSIMLYICLCSARFLRYTAYAAAYIYSVLTAVYCYNLHNPHTKERSYAAIDYTNTQIQKRTE